MEIVGECSTACSNISSIIHSGSRLTDKQVVEMTFLLTGILCSLTVLIGEDIVCCLAEYIQGIH